MELETKNEMAGKKNVKVFTLKKHKEMHIKDFDFSRPSKFSKDQFRILEMIYSTFTRIAETNLSVQLRTLTEIKIKDIEQKTFLEYINSLPGLCYINVLGSTEFKGDTLIEFESKLIFIILDRLLGGKGESINEREFTDIEKTLIHEIIVEFLIALKESWKNIVDLNLKVKSEETNPQFVRVIALNEMCVIIEFEMNIGNKKGIFTFCLPFVAIESVLGKLTTRRWYSDSEDAESDNQEKHLFDNLKQVEMEPSVILGRAQVPLKEINSLEIGDIIKLDRKVNKNLELAVGEEKIFKVIPGKIGKTLAVQIADICEIKRGG